MTQLDMITDTISRLKATVEAVAAPLAGAFQPASGAPEVPQSKRAKKPSLQRTDASAKSQARRSSTSPKASKSPRSKKAELIGLLSCKSRATMQAMMTATGWQAHSVRAGLSGLRKDGFGLERRSNRRGECATLGLPAKGWLGGSTKQRKTRKHASTSSTKQRPSVHDASSDASSRLKVETAGRVDELSIRSHEVGTRERATALVSKPRPSPRQVRRSIKPGTRLLREWRGQTHEVIADGSGGFIYRGETYCSLSAVARLITGTRWSGPVFFGIATKAQADRSTGQHNG